MATLYIHAGHPKTGSSYLQHVLRTNTSILAENGIIYAVGNDRNISPGKTISVGNAALLFQSRENFLNSLKINRISHDQSLLFTSEIIFLNFLENNADEFLEEIALNYGFDRIKILIFIRNPVNLCASRWQQRIKRGGETKTDFARLEWNKNGAEFIFLLENWINRLEKLKSVELTIRNYSYCYDRILDEVSNWLDLPLGVLIPSSVKRVNRSMTYSELQFLVALNKVIGKANFVSDALCEEIPEIETELIMPPHEIQKAIWEYVEPVISRINPKIPIENRYSSDFSLPNSMPDFLQFSNNQINVIAKCIGNQIIQLEQENIALKNEVEKWKMDLSDFRPSNVPDNKGNAFSLRIFSKKLLRNFFLTDIFLKICA